MTERARFNDFEPMPIDLSTLFVIIPRPFRGSQYLQESSQALCGRISQVFGFSTETVQAFFNDPSAAEAPSEPESFRATLDDFEKKVMPATLHWRHPDNYAYFGSGNGLSNVLADMLIASCGGVAFSWV